MLTEKMSGIFDCRKYDQSGKLAHDQRPLLADTDNIALSVIVPIGQVPDCFKINGEIDPMLAIRASKRERQAAEAEGREPIADVAAAKFKIGQNCKWFDKHAKAMDRPTNAELEAGRYQVQVDFTRKEKDPANPLKPSGYWANAIMLRLIEQNPFDGQAFEAAAEPEEDAPAEQAEYNDDLPFD